MQMMLLYIKKLKKANKMKSNVWQARYVSYYSGVLSTSLLSLVFTPMAYDGNKATLGKQAVATVVYLAKRYILYTT